MHTKKNATWITGRIHKSGFKILGLKATILSGAVLAMAFLAENGALHSHQFTLERSKGARSLPRELKVMKSSSLVIAAPSSFEDVLEYTCVYSGKKYVAVRSNENLFQLDLKHLWGLDDVFPARIYKRSIAKLGPDWEELQKLWPSGRAVIQERHPEDLNHPDILAQFPEECQMHAERMARGMDENFVPDQDIRNYISEHFGVKNTNELMLLAGVPLGDTAESVPREESSIIPNLKKLAGML